MIVEDYGEIEAFSSSGSSSSTEHSLDEEDDEEDDDEDYGPIEAYVKKDDDTVEEIDAENIDVLPTTSEIAEKARNKLRKYSILGALCLVVTITAVMVPLSLTVLRPKKPIIVDTTPSAAPSSQPSQSPTTQHFTEYVEFFSQISSMDDLTTFGSPQYRASRWIYNFDPLLRDLSHPRLMQRYIAAVFYYSTSKGEGWADCFPGDVGCTSDSQQSWLSAYDECQWYGFAECNEDGFLTRFVILNNQNGDGNVNYGNNLHGTFPSEFGYLSNLTDFTISKNPYLTSTIPITFSKLTNLRKLRFVNNGLQGPWNEGLLQNMTDLSDLLLNYNEFDIPLPLDIANVRSLKTLAMAGNKFHGKIPSEYKQLHRLERLELHANQLSGEVPSDLVIATLKFLSLEENNLVGSIADTICNMAHEYSLKDLIVDCDEVRCNCCLPPCSGDSSNS